MDPTLSRARMVDDLARQGVVRDQRVRDALLHVPRHEFLPPALRDDAHVDSPAPIGSGQTISAPHMVAMMAETLDVRPNHRVLEVGGGSGYHAAVLSLLCAPGEVVSVEYVPALAARARDTLRRLGFANVEVVEGDGSEGHGARAPYDRISVAAAAPAVPGPLLEQLAPGGVLVIPVGGRDTQTLLRVTKDEEGTLDDVPLGACKFVPLLGKHGWPE